MKIKLNNAINKFASHKSTQLNKNILIFFLSNPEELLLQILIIIKILQVNLLVPFPSLVVVYSLKVKKYCKKKNNGSNEEGKSQGREDRVNSVLQKRVQIPIFHSLSPSLLCSHHHPRQARRQIFLHHR